VTRALVTGGAGFNGGHLCRYLLNRGDEVVAVDNLSRGVIDGEFRALMELPRFTFIDANLLEENALDKVPGSFDLIFHFAAIIGVANVLGRPYDVLTHNVAMHAEAIRFARRQKSLKRFVFASTSEVYAGTLQSFGIPLPTTEATPLTINDTASPRTSYMLSKIYGEAMTKHSGLPYTIIRPHNVYGPRMGMAHVIPELLKKAHNASPGSALEVASIDHRRAFCYIDDAIELIVRGAESSEAKDEVLNVGNESAEASIKTVAETVVEVTGRDLVITAGPVTAGSPPRRSPDMSRAVAATGYEPRIGLREGIEKTFAWYRSKVFEGAEVSAR
jgi:nucleoside-diphosphate-sugar epimerase